MPIFQSKKKKKECMVFRFCKSDVWLHRRLLDSPICFPSRSAEFIACVVASGKLHCTHLEEYEHNRLTFMALLQNIFDLNWKGPRMLQSPLEHALRTAGIGE